MHNRQPLPTKNNHPQKPFSQPHPPPPPLHQQQPLCDNHNPQQEKKKKNQIKPPPNPKQISDEDEDLCEDEDRLQITTPPTLSDLLLLTKRSWPIFEISSPDSSVSVLSSGVAESDRYRTDSLRVWWFEERVRMSARQAKWAKRKRIKKILKKKYYFNKCRN